MPPPSLFHWLSLEQPDTLVGSTTDNNSFSSKPPANMTLRFRLAGLVLCCASLTASNALSIGSKRSNGSLSTNDRPASELFPPFNASSKGAGLSLTNGSAASNGSTNFAPFGDLFHTLDPPAKGGCNSEQQFKLRAWLSDVAAMLDYLLADLNNANLGTNYVLRRNFFHYLGVHIDDKGDGFNVTARLRLNRAKGNGVPVFEPMSPV